MNCFPSGTHEMAVDGDIILILDTTAQSGKDYDLVQALNALGWGSLI